MCDCINCLLDPKDWTILFIGFFFTIIWTAIWSFLLYLLKPELEIVEIIKGTYDENGKKKNYLNIKVKNKGASTAVNLKIEASIKTEGFTYHLELDKKEFLILPPKITRGFKSDDITEAAKKSSKILGVENPDKLFNSFLNDQPQTAYYIRVKIHANHEYSGFGKAFEQKFKWNEKEQKFIKCPNTCKY